MTRIPCCVRANAEAELDRGPRTIFEFGSSTRPIAGPSCSIRIPLTSPIAAPTLRTESEGRPWVAPTALTA